MDIKKLPDIMTQEEVRALTGLKKGSLYNFMDNHDFPRPKKMGLRMARWSKKEVLDWLKDKGFSLEEVE